MIEDEVGGMSAVKLGEASVRLVQELAEDARLPEAAGAGIARIDGELRRHQDRVQPGFGQLAGYALPVTHVPLQRRLVAVQKHHDG